MKHDMKLIFESFRKWANKTNNSPLTEATLVPPPPPAVLVAARTFINAVYPTLASALGPGLAMAGGLAVGTALDKKFKLSDPKPVGTARGTEAKPGDAGYDSDLYQISPEKALKLMPREKLLSSAKVLVQAFVDFYNERQIDIYSPLPENDPETQAMAPADRGALARDFEIYDVRTEFEGVDNSNKTSGFPTVQSLSVHNDGELRSLILNLREYISKEFGEKGVAKPGQLTSRAVKPVDEQASRDPVADEIMNTLRAMYGIQRSYMFGFVTDRQMASKVGAVLALLKKYPRHKAWAATDYYSLGKLVDRASKAGKAIYKMHDDALMLLKSLKTNPTRSVKDTFAAEKGEVKRLKGLLAVKRFLETPDEYYLDMTPANNRGLQLQAHYADAHEAIKNDVIACKSLNSTEALNPTAKRLQRALDRGLISRESADEKCEFANDIHKKVWDKYEKLKKIRETGKKK